VVGVEPGDAVLVGIDEGDVDFGLAALDPDRTELVDEGLGGGHDEQLRLPARPISGAGQGGRDHDRAVGEAFAEREARGRAARRPDDEPREASAGDGRRADTEEGPTSELGVVAHDRGV
jgi:hypothetical protein